MSVFAKGMLATVGIMGSLFGMVYLLLSMVLGPRLAYWVEGAITFGVITILSAIWFFSALGPVGPDTQWQAIAIGPNLTQASHKGVTYNVGAYPNDDWQSPKVGQHLADLKGADDTDSEAAQAKPVIDLLITNAISPIEGLRNSVQSQVKGEVNLTPGSFTASNTKMKQAKVEGKDSIIAVALAVPSKAITATLPAGVTEGTVKQYLGKVGDKVMKGQDLLVITTPDGKDVTLQAADGGDLVLQSLRVGDKVRSGLPIATIGLTGQPDQPPPVTVVAVRVRGKLRTPAMIYLLVSLILFAIHLAGLNATEKARKATLAPAPA